MIPNKIRKCSCIYIYRKCASSAKLSVLQKCECTCKTVEKRWRIHVHANNKINTFYFRMHCKFSKTIRIWKNKILSSLTNAIYFFLLIQVMRKRNEYLIYLFFASYRWHITHVWTSPVFVLIYELRRLNRTWNH